MIPRVIKSTLITSLDEDTTAWKKAIIYTDDVYGFDMAIVKLTIPKDAAVVASKHKCRAPYAKVEGIYPVKPFEPTEPLDETIAYSYFKYPSIFAYQVGKTVQEPWFDIDPTNICSRGIHFFRTYIEAADYDFT